MNIRPMMPSRPSVPVRSAARPVAKPAVQPQAAAPVKAAEYHHGIAKWSLIGGTGLGAFGIPMMAMLGGAGLGLWILPAALAGAAFGAVCYGGLGFLVDRIVGHFKK